MGHNDHIDFDLHTAIEDLVDEGDLQAGSKEHGVARRS